MKHLWGNQFAALDFETAGLPGESDPIQIGIACFDSDLNPTGDTFNELIRPRSPVTVGAYRVHRIEEAQLQSAPPADAVEEMLSAWVQSLGMPSGKRLIPICHNWICEARTLYWWLGADRTHNIFHHKARDTFTLAASLQDAGFLPDDLMIGLTDLCDHFAIERATAHDALNDAMATGKLYKKLLAKVSEKFQ